MKGGESKLMKERRVRERSRPEERESVRRKLAREKIHTLKLLARGSSVRRSARREEHTPKRAQKGKSQTRGISVIEATGRRKGERLRRGTKG